MNRYGLPWQEIELPENPLAGIEVWAAKEITFTLGVLSENAVMSFAQIAPAALQLPPRERASLAESLWESLEDPYCLSTALSDEEALRLAIARDKEIESGAVTPVSHDEMMRRLRG